MPRSRSGTKKQPGRGMYIVCEGATEHSEYAYIDGFLKKNNLKIPSLKLVPSNKNNPLGLVNDILNKKKIAEDILWAVFDNDHHSDLDKAIQIAKANGVNVALSTISFELWIYLHFGFTTRPFRNSDDVISEIASRYNYTYSKNNMKIFEKMTHKLHDAKNHAVNLRNYGRQNCTGLKHHWNPWTNFDQLLDSIENFVNEENSGQRLNIKYDLPW